VSTCGDAQARHATIALVLYLNVYGALPMTLTALPDILSGNLTVIFCGINPGQSSAERGLHFANRSNRFWKVIHQAGFTPECIAPEEGRSLLDYGCGLTTAVSRPTRSAGELSWHEFIAATDHLRTKIQTFAPRHIAFLGKVAYQAIFDQKNVAWGCQFKTFAGAMVWVLPNPSGLNRAFSLEDLVAEYKLLYVESADLQVRGRIAMYPNVSNRHGDT